MARPIHSVDQQNVLPAVAVVIEESATRSERLRQQLSAIRATVVLKLNSRRSSYIRETKAGIAARLRKNPSTRDARRDPCRTRLREKISPPQGRLTRPFRIA